MELSKAAAQDLNPSPLLDINNNIIPTTTLSRLPCYKVYTVPSVGPSGDLLFISNSDIPTITLPRSSRIQKLTKTPITLWEIQPKSVSVTSFDQQTSSFRIQDQETELLESIGDSLRQMRSKADTAQDEVVAVESPSIFNSLTKCFNFDYESEVIGSVLEYFQGQELVRSVINGRWWSSPSSPRDQLTCNGYKFTISGHNLLVKGLKVNCQTFGVMLKETEGYRIGLDVLLRDGAFERHLTKTTTDSSCTLVLTDDTDTANTVEIIVPTGICTGLLRWGWIGDFGDVLRVMCP